MQRWVLIDTARIPGSAEELRLLQRGAEFAINLGREMLMGSRMRASEEALARLGCAALRDRTDCAVLIGGLGMGFTLRAALDTLPPTAQIEVAELVPAVVTWVRGPLAALSQDCLADPRVSIHQGDVGALLQIERSRYDAILLDVDNGPEGLTKASNHALYEAGGLRNAWTALKPGGVLGVWSAGGDAGFTQRLTRIGFDVAPATVRAHAGRGARHTIWIATRPRSGRPQSAAR